MSALIRAARPRLTYANVAASIALFVSLSAGAYATIRIPTDSIGSKQIVSGAIRSAEIKDQSILLKDIFTGNSKTAPAPLPMGSCPPGEVVTFVASFAGGNFKCVPEVNPAVYDPPADGLPACGGFSAETGDHCLAIPGLPVKDGDPPPPPGLPACPANAVAGTLCTSSSGGRLGEGDAINGVIGNLGPLAANRTYYTNASFIFEAANLVGGNEVRVAGYDDPGGKCTGSFQSPYAPPGYVCIYPVVTADVASLEGVALADDVGSKAGFDLKIQTDGQIDNSVSGVEGSWAYTADEPGGDR